MGRSRFIIVLTLGGRKFGEPHAWGIGKSPLWAMAATSPRAHNSYGGNGKLTEPTGACGRTFWKYAYEPFSP